MPLLLETRIRAHPRFLNVNRNARSKSSAVFGSVVASTRHRKRKNARRPWTNDEWIRFTDKPTINHRPIVYQQTGRIRLAGWILLLDFFDQLRSNAVYTPRYYGVLPLFA